MNIDEHQTKVVQLINELKEVFDNNEFMMIGSLASSCITKDRDIEYWKKLALKKKDDNDTN